MTKEEFKARWEKDDQGDGITWNDIAKCAIEWGISQRPKTQDMYKIRSLVLKAAGVESIDEE